MILINNGLNEFWNTDSMNLWEKKNTRENSVESFFLRDLEYLHGYGMDACRQGRGELFMIPALYICGLSARCQSLLKRDRNLYRPTFLAAGAHAFWPPRSG